ncbi:hypothetical protein HYH03_004548 [Edaphochlamys debaryana]|uniref:Uncharacterized protein n=1 Tax=Edaphochlamys debaryana TaxID=47281 RepID=A0A835Y9C9_9CHLO|nr:hypothetical protein HYH03_004548 [Edaphochlamys debaryana]|eukprot:KAG2497392.1 hypothetical protein HYH03_004548 [Edaphochlamys debaryana]
MVVADLGPLGPLGPLDPLGPLGMAPAGGTLGRGPKGAATGMTAAAVAVAEGAEASAATPLEAMAALQRHPRFANRVGPLPLSAVLSPLRLAPRWAVRVLSGGVAELRAGGAA